MIKHIKVMILLSYVLKYFMSYHSSEFNKYRKNAFTYLLDARN